MLGNMTLNQATSKDDTEEYLSEMIFLTTQMLSWHHIMTMLWFFFIIELSSFVHIHSCVGRWEYFDSCPGMVLNLWCSNNTVQYLFTENRVQHQKGVSNICKFSSQQQKHQQSM